MVCIQFQPNFKNMHDLFIFVNVTPQSNNWFFQIRNTFRFTNNQTHRCHQCMWSKTHGCHQTWVATKQYYQIKSLSTDLFTIPLTSYGGVIHKFFHLQNDIISISDTLDNGISRATCPDVMHGVFSSVTITDNTGGSACTGNSVNVCSDRVIMNYTYNSCATGSAFSSRNSQITSFIFLQ